MENNQFDEIDEKILQMLAKDGNIPFQEVARACGVSGTTIHTRVKRLTSLGFVQGSKYIINPCQEVCLILYCICSRSQPNLSIVIDYPGIMPRCDSIKKTSYLTFETSELDEPITHYIGIGCKTLT